eukprot:Nk52_evm68s1020 gene=Nk52_evmTU68s1020
MEDTSITHALLEKRQQDRRQSTSNLVGDVLLAKKTPSKYITEMSWTTAERLKKVALSGCKPRIIELHDMADHCEYKESMVQVDEPLFSPYPSKLVFQSYEPFNTYSVNVTLRNNDKVARRVKVLKPESSNFEVVTTKKHFKKIAPGMEAEYEVRFTPHDENDYKCDLVVETEREKFVVPIEGIGARALLDFPDEINLGTQAVKHESIKTILVRNIGNRACTFRLLCTEPFSLSDYTAQLEVNASMQIEIKFNPKFSKAYEGEMEVCYDTNEKVYIKLYGIAEDANIRLEKTSLRLENTYITMASQRSVKVLNRSDIMAKVSWHRYFNEEEEEKQREMDYARLREEEVKELEDPSMQDDPEGKSLIIQKYKNKRKAVEQKKMLYEEGAFAVSPVESTVWPYSEANFTFSFYPPTADSFCETLYCEISGRESRLPLTIKSKGIGPKARFSYDVFDIGDVFLNSTHIYEAVLENIGDIPCPYKLQPSDSLFWSKFTFSPEEGVLQVGDKQSIQVRFRSEILGMYTEDFVFALESSSEVLTLQFKGHVIGPTFHFNKSKLDFGTVTYGFVNTQVVSLINTSLIPMAYKLRVPADEGFYGEKEFKVTPSSGIIPQQSEQDIKVEFTSKFSKLYNLGLVVDVDIVGEELMSLPITAVCVVPSIVLTTPLLDFSTCYLNYPYEKVLELSNDSDLPARFELMHSDALNGEQTEGGITHPLSFFANMAKGTINAHSTIRITISISVKEVGPIELPIRFRIAGSEEQPLQASIVCCGKGPEVKVLSHSLDWGKIPVLTPNCKILTLKNSSPIDAYFSSQLISKTNVFSVTPMSGSIKALDSLDVSITALLDDVIKFNDKLVIYVKNGEEFTVSLTASGTGTTIICSETTRAIAFGNIFSSQDCFKTLSFKNNGRRQQTLMWIVDGHLAKAKRNEGEQVGPVFSATPERLVLEPGDEQDVCFKGSSKVAIKSAEKLLCQAVIGKNLHKDQIFNFQLSANFIDPLLEFSSTQLIFLYMHGIGLNREIQTKVFTMKNVSKLPLTINLKTSYPFTLDMTGVYLEPEDSASINVHFDPAYKKDNYSEKKKGKISISYLEHPLTSSISLVGDVCFPDLKFSTKQVNFGCVLNGTESVYEIEVTNTGLLEATYSWKFLESKTSFTFKAEKQEGITIDQVFDILPLQSTLQPDETETVQFSFYDMSNGDYSTTAVCSVNGGPDYEIEVKGQSSIIKYTLDHNHLDFGKQLFRNFAESYVTIHNTSDVGFDFQISEPVHVTKGAQDQRDMITVSPTKGHVSAHTKAVLTLKFLPLVPECVHDVFEIQIAHFEPERLVVKGEGVFPKLALSLPKLEDERFLLKAEEARKSLAQSRGTTADAVEEADVLVELERLMMVEHALEQVNKGSGVSDRKLQSHVTGWTGTDSRLPSPSKLGDVSAAVGRRPWKFEDTANLIEYVCDFGNIVRGSFRRQTFQVHNTGFCPVSLQIGKKVLANTGFSIDMDKLKNLQGAPSNEVVDVVVNLSTKHVGPLGPVEVMLPLEIAGGPVIKVWLKAKITLPDLQISNESIDFGVVSVGQCRIATVQLHNYKQAPCEWHATTKKPSLFGESKVEPPCPFIVIPSSGVLAPDEKLNVEIKFTPTSEDVHSFQIPFKIKMNPKAHIVKAKGVGTESQLVFTPSVVEFNAILPYSGGDENKVTVFNPTARPVEMFSVDFDKKYLEEEEILRSTEGYINGMLLLPPREVGEGLPPELVDAFYRSKQRIESENTNNDSRAASVQPPEEDDPANEDKKTGKSSPTALSHCNEDAQDKDEIAETPVAAAIARHLGIVINKPLAKFDPTINIIIHGAPFAGKTSQAQKLSKTFKIPIVNVQDIVDELLSGDDDLAEQLHDALNGNIADKENAGQAPTVTGDIDNSTGNFLPDTLLQNCIERKLSEFCSRGIIFDGLECKYCSSMVHTLIAILTALGKKKRAFFCNLSIDPVIAQYRELLLNRKLAEENARINRKEEVPEIDEDVYDLMTEEEQEMYDRKYQEYKKYLAEEVTRQECQKREDDFLPIGQENKLKQVAKKTAKIPIAAIGAMVAGKKMEKKISMLGVGNSLTQDKSMKEKESKGPSGRSTPTRGTNNPKQGVSQKELTEKLETKVQEDKVPNVPPPAASKPVKERERRGSVSTASIVAPYEFDEEGRCLNYQPGLQKESLDPEQVAQILGSMSEDACKKYVCYNETYDSIVQLIKHWPEKGADFLTMNVAAVPEKPHGKEAKEQEKKKSKEKADKADKESKENAGYHLPRTEILEELATSESAKDSVVPVIVVDGNLEPDMVSLLLLDKLPDVADDNGDEAKILPIPPTATYERITYPPPRPVLMAPEDYLFQIQKCENGQDEAFISPEPEVKDGPRPESVSPTKSEGGKKKGLPGGTKGSVMSRDDEDTDMQHRWIVPANGSIDLIVSFASNQVGRFDQTLTFEIVGSSRQYTLFARGTCQFPTISKEPKVLFPRKKKLRNTEEIIKHCYISETSTYEVGPLLCGKPKDKHEEIVNGDHVDRFNIVNTSLMPVSCDFALYGDPQGSPFSLEPQSMEMGIGEHGMLTLTSYAKNVGHFEDKIVCTVKDNPTPIILNISCNGVKPEVECDTKALVFERLLLHRSDTKTLTIKNNTLLPLMWKIAGTESLGEEFVVSPLSGEIYPGKSQTLTAVFKAIKPVVLKKVIKLEVYDLEKLLGVVQSESIHVTAEAYDVALDVHFPKGCDGGLEFGCIKVFDEMKHVLTLKNKGKYEIGFKFLFDQNKTESDIFTMTPKQGVLVPNEKPFPVQVVFKAQRELYLKDSPYLQCQVIEVLTNEIIATIPVKVSVRAVFSKFSVQPSRDINFGAMVYNTKKTRTFTIENLGDFEFKYSIFKDPEGTSSSAKAKLGNTKLQRASSKTSLAAKQPPPGKQQREVSKSKPGDQGKLTLGMFVISPATGVVSPGAIQTITVECHAETEGRCEENIGIDITDKHPDEREANLNYKLVGETCVPGINTSDFNSIFEEHLVVRRHDLFSQQRNVYAEDERVFMFGSIIVGQQAHARFKISNPHKVSCDVILSVKPRSKSGASDFSFDVEPKKTSIVTHEHCYVTVTFSPASMQTYTGIFEATVENGVNPKTRSLIFELRGEGKCHTLPVILKNEGSITANVYLEMALQDEQRDSAFSCPKQGAPLAILPSQSQPFNITFSPKEKKLYSGCLRMKILDNLFEDSEIMLSGEGFLEDVSIECENGYDIDFGDCTVGEPKAIPITVTNHSQESLKYSFTNLSEFTFIPSSGHLKPQVSKEILVVYNASQVQELKQQKASCKFKKIAFPVPLYQVPDWDDKSRNNRWNNKDIAKFMTRRNLDSEPEPEHEVLDTIHPNDVDLSLNALADYAKIDFDVAPIHFKSTMMFQSRSFQFPLKNTGNVRLNYSWEIVSTMPDEAEDEDEGTEFPFSVEPESGVINAGQTAFIDVRFSPQEVHYFSAKLVCTIPNLHSSCTTPSVDVHGTSLRPYCHFELESSDYITAGRRNPELNDHSGSPGGVLDPETRVIEFESCGIKIKNIKRFYIVNPTNMSYEFRWDPVDEAAVSKTAFRCLTPKGVVMAGKKYEISFEFIPDNLDILESFWTFSIPDYNIKLPVLLVGQAFEPNVHMSRPNVNFKALLVDRTAKETVMLINNEEAPFSFVFNESSLQTEGSSALLQISPMSGTVAANTEIPVNILFTPKGEKEFNFNVTCIVKKKPTPLAVNVKGEGYAIRDSMFIEGENGKLIELFPGTTNSIDFKDVQVKERSIKQFTIINSGKFNFGYTWKLDESNYISISPETGTIPKNERQLVDIVFQPSHKINIRNLSGSCKITNGRTYNFSINAEASQPALKFSTNKIDFGQQFLHKPGMPLIQKILTVQNDDAKEVSVDCVFVNKPYLEVHATPTMLEPGQRMEVPVLFYPKACVKYSETISFQINGLSDVDVEVSGEGVELKLELSSPIQKQVNFGALRIGQKASRQLKVTNKSVTAASILLNTPANERLFTKYCVSIFPIGRILLRPKQTITIDIKYKPGWRIPSFVEEIEFECMQLSFPLFVMTGACHGVEIKLDNDNVAFGAVVQKSQSNRRICIQNTGDVGARYEWDSKRFEPDFSISPLEGYVTAGGEVSFEVNFHPEHLNSDIRYENIECKLEGLPSLFLTLSGMCIAQPPQSEIVKFNTPVRTKETKTIPLHNKTSSRWVIRPVIENEYWSGPECVVVESNKTEHVEVVYFPLTMITENKHQGSIFFPLPDGTGLLYLLNGSTDHPKPIATISREVPSKTSYTEMLTVTNWLKTPQRFRVSIETPKPDPSLILKGLDYIDVPGLMRREYKLNFYSYKEGLYSCKVTCKNEQTQEYIYYNVNFKALPPGIMSTLELSTPVRQTLVQHITIENHLPTPVTHTVQGNVPEVTVPHTFITPAHGEGSCPVEFMPLRVGETTGRVTITSAELGIYQYDLKLVATPAAPERSLHFKCPIGASQIQTFRFNSFLKQRGEYTCKIDNPDFIVDKSIAVAAGTSSPTEVGLDIQYEPSKLGVSRSTLYVSSPTGGEYSCPLFGHCGSSKPQGPVSVRAGSASSISFKNVFSQATTFYFSVDNPAFVVKDKENIQSKKVLQVSVTYKPGQGKSAKTGKLVVSSSQYPSKDDITWVYYLKGST